MMKLLLGLLGKTRHAKDDFSDFFRHASAEEQKKVYLEALRKANEEQGRVFKKATNK